MNSISEILKKIKDKPALYLPYNSIRCLKAFIYGYFTREPETVYDFDILEHDFTRWVQNKYGVHNHSWDRTIEFFSLNEYDAFSTFFELFNDFLDERVEGVN